ncbi:hypothetical protein SBRCBS47491_010247 [Sporothrix bragantina]|uniref:Uncharacterized protein n=1 Tax=Sporothrix bragantina TaxID=671064 RepID=A0ABP0D1W1_9PEZI
MGPGERWAAEYHRLTQAEEDAEQALEEAAARLRRLRTQRKSHQATGKKMLEEAYAVVDADDERRWQEETRAAAQAAEQARTEADAAGFSYDWAAIMADLGPEPLIASTPPVTGGSS